MKSLTHKRLIIFLIIIIIITLIVFKFYKKEEVKLIKNIEPIEENFSNSNIIKDIKYTSRDLKGNEYTILAEEGEIDLNNSDFIFLKNVTAYIKLIKNNELITIISNFGKYNTVNYDTIFSKDVKINYLDNRITGNYLDFSMMKNLLIISKNVVYTNPENILKADVVELDTLTKDTKIFMHNYKEKILVKSRN
ncbi:LPS export ABC transporter periplasmic protein LptC [Candidatus Pelagibacter sp.]|nr:LPS export ABC transporter periplasmic protein LptC [Candidatus Pelagibacter sp.]